MARSRPAPRLPATSRAVLALLPALAALVPAAASLVACGGPTTPIDGPTADDRAATRAAFDSARRRWDAVGIESYRYRYRRLCFCAPPVTEPVRITVRAGSVAEVVFAGSGEPAASLSDYPTIDGIFALIGEALETEAYEVRVEYDPALGYPVSVYVDRNPMIADEEQRIEAGELEPLR
jgi:Family of unknown function (DUF6174)